MTSNGETLFYGSQSYSPDLNKTHQVKLTDLKPNTKYVFEIMSQSKNYVYDANYEFTTTGSSE